MNLDELNRALLDPTAPIPAGWPAGAWGVLLLFLVPIGGGIPSGVLMAADRGIPWPAMLALYFVSDVILACVFEPFLRLLIAAGRAIPLLGRFAAFIRRMVQRTAAQYGNAAGPLPLVLVSFGVDPMTGRAAAAAAGHGFVPGWAIAITGDMFYFALLMVSTLWLNHVLGDERLTVGVMLFVMLVLPSFLRRARTPVAPAKAPAVSPAAASCGARQRPELAPGGSRAGRRHRR
ncbi:MAG TPA: hypothetical protein VFD92_10225 [Candidatus Binatia bacterium]|nr:hypothetical protein [Candidatus Binatia bacterium]